MTHVLVINDAHTETFDEDLNELEARLDEMDDDELAELADALEEDADVKAMRSPVLNFGNEGEDTRAENLRRLGLLREDEAEEPEDLTQSPPTITFPSAPSLYVAQAPVGNRAFEEQDLDMLPPTLNYEDAKQRQAAKPCGCSLPFEEQDLDMVPPSSL